MQLVTDKFPDLQCHYVHTTHGTPTAELHSVAALLQACGRVSQDTSLFVFNACSATSPKVANNLLGYSLGWHQLPNDSRHVRVTVGRTDPTFSALKDATEHERNSQSPGRWSVCISKPCGGSKRELDVFYSNEVEYEPASPVSRAGLAAFAANLCANTVKAMEASGVFFQEARSCWVAPTIIIGMDSYIGPGVQIYGLTEVSLLPAHKRLHLNELGMVREEHRLSAQLGSSACCVCVHDMHLFMSKHNASLCCCRLVRMFRSMGRLSSGTPS